MARKPHGHALGRHGQGVDTIKLDAVAIINQFAAVIAYRVPTRIAPHERPEYRERISILRRQRFAGFIEMVVRQACAYDLNRPMVRNPLFREVFGVNRAAPLVRG